MSEGQLSEDDAKLRRVLLGYMSGTVELDVAVDVLIASYSKSGSQVVATGHFATDVEERRFEALRASFEARLVEEHGREP